MIPFFTSFCFNKINLRSFLIITKLARQQHPHALSSLSSSPSFFVSEQTCGTLLYYCNRKSLIQGISLHSPITKLGLYSQLYIINNLLSLYSKCFSVIRARRLFDEMPVRDVVSWTCIISAHFQIGHQNAALELFQRMTFSGIIPNQFTYPSVIRCASSVGDFDLGVSLHAQIVKQGFQACLVIASALLDFYSKCDELEDALRIFSRTQCKDVVLWTVMISALVEAGDLRGALKFFISMVASGVSPNEFTFVKMLMACSFLDEFHPGLVIHAQLILQGIELNLILKTALVDFYGKCRRMRDALKVLHQTPDSDVMLWTAMVSGYSQSGNHKEAIMAFKAMEIAGVLPNSVTITTLLNVCAHASLLDLGMQVHSRVVKIGLDRHLSVGYVLVDLYAKLSSSLNDPVRAFGELCLPDVFSWTDLIAGFARHEKFKEVFAAFTEMRAKGVEPDSYTLSTILKCIGSSSEALPHAKRIHAYILKTNVDAFDPQMIIRNSLVDAYARMMKIDDAFSVANNMLLYKDTFTYTSLAKGLNQMGLHNKSLGIINPMMHDRNARIDGYSLATFISATAGLAAVKPGKQLHCYSIKSGLTKWISVSNGLIDMYSKCGRINEALLAFSSIQGPNVVSWNVLISGLASNGHFSDALSAFEDMRLSGTIPDKITFLVILYACSHGSLVDLGVEYFNLMEKTYRIEPEFDHYVCFVDLLGRAGRLEDAACAIETMGMEVEDPLIYKTLLSCCKMHGNVVTGECMARRCMEMDVSDPAVYVMLAGIYDDAGKMEMGEEIRRMMRERGLSKCTGRSWVESRNL